MPVNRLTESPTDPGGITTAHVSLSLCGECLGWVDLFTLQSVGTQTREVSWQPVLHLELVVSRSSSHVP